MPWLSHLGPFWVLFFFFSSFFDIFDVLMEFFGLKRSYNTSLLPKHTPWVNLSNELPVATSAQSWRVVGGLAAGLSSVQVRLAVVVLCCVVGHSQLRVWPGGASLPLSLSPSVHLTIMDHGQLARCRLFCMRRRQARQEMLLVYHTTPGHNTTISHSQSNQYFWVLETIQS